MVVVCSGIFRWWWHWTWISLHLALPCPAHPIPHSLSPAPLASMPCCQCAQGTQGHIWKCLDVATQCLTNNITKASVTRRHLLFLGDIRQLGGMLTAFSLPLCSFPLITCGVLSITQWKRPSFWQENGEDWLGNKSCHEQRFFLSQRIWARSPIGIDLQDLKSHYMPK